MNLVRYILFASVFLTLAAGSVRAQGLSEYTDDFSTDQARSDCYSSSTFWPRDINCPPARPYLFYYSTGDARGLAFMDYGEEPAQLVYGFVVSAAPAGTPVRGTLRLDVSFPCDTELSQFPPGQLFYSTSGDGLAWSTPQSLQAGHREIPVPSAKNTCYVLLGGARAVIDNLRFSPAAPGATVRLVSTGDPGLLSNGAILHVDGQSGSDRNDGHNRTNAFATVQEAINMAQDGDTVVVWPGVYEEEIRLKGKAITVQSAADAAVITAPDGYAFSFYDAEGPETIVTNFVIAGCGKSGIFCDFGSSPTLRNLTVTGNQVAGVEIYGGANPYIVNSIIWGNARGQLSAQWKANFNWRVYYSCIGIDDPRNPSNLSKTAGNIRADPKFVDSPNADYHLKSQWGRYVPWTDTWVFTDRETSLCIDAGDPTDGSRAERVPNGGRINLGAYGGTPYASLSSGPPCK
jgi:hypothetical protein